MKRNQSLRSINAIVSISAAALTLKKNNLANFSTQKEKKSKFFIFFKAKNFLLLLIFIGIMFLFSCGGGGGSGGNDKNLSASVAPPPPSTPPPPPPPDISSDSCNENICSFEIDECQTSICETLQITFDNVSQDSTLIVTGSVGLPTLCTETAIELGNTNGTVKIIDSDIVISSGEVATCSSTIQFPDESTLTIEPGGTLHTCKIELYGKSTFGENFGEYIDVIALKAIGTEENFVNLYNVELSWEDSSSDVEIEFANIENSNFRRQYVLGSGDLTIKNSIVDRRTPKSGNINFSIRTGVVHAGKFIIENNTLYQGRIYLDEPNFEHVLSIQGNIFIDNDSSSRSGSFDDGFISDPVGRIHFNHSGFDRNWVAANREETDLTALVKNNSFIINSGQNAISCSTDGGEISIESNYFGVSSLDEALSLILDSRTNLTYGCTFPEVGFTSEPLRKLNTLEKPFLSIEKLSNSSFNLSYPYFIDYELLEVKDLTYETTLTVGEISEELSLVIKIQNTSE